LTGKILLRGGCVLTLASKTPNFPRADVLIEDDVVAEVGPGLRSRDAELVDATDTIVMPGFIDTHRHAWRSLFRNLSESGAVVSSDRYRPDDVYAATLIGLLGAVEAGITTVADWSDVRLDNDLAEAALKAHADTGLRTVFVPAVGGVSPDAASATRQLLGRVAELTGPLTTIAIGSADPGSGHTDADEWDLARELGLRIHAHFASETSVPGAISGLADRGLLDDHVTLFHCSRLGEADTEAIRSSGASVSLAPSSEMARGLGSPPIQELIDRGIRPALAVDDERMAPGDVFAQMRATISLQHATVFDRKLAGKAGLPRLMTTRDVIRFATVEGARATGLAGSVGSLEPGMQADLIVLRTDRPNISPVNDPIGAVVWGMDTSNVDWVIVGGQVLMRSGVLKADVQRARAMADSARRRVAPESSLAVGATPGGER
jgi:cytosine/adenosine deaminase-related metal-dependent hydrolase